LYRPPAEQANHGRYNAQMDSTLSPGAATLVADLQRVFGRRLRCVVGYGPHIEGDTDAPLTGLALVDALSVADLEACAGRSAHWARAGIATPLILPEDEFGKSLDAFPVEYGEIIRAHRDLYGEDPFADVSIASADLRRACETQVKSHLLHLREQFIESGGAPREVGDLVRTAAPAFAALLRTVARLAGASTSDRVETARTGARAAGVSEHVVGEVLALERPSGAPMPDAAGLFPEYLAAVEQLARAVDAWPVT
jgi:hypothetical protein